MNYNEYPPEWKDVIRPQILRRDHYKCVHCSVKHRSKAILNARNKYTEVDEFTEVWAKSNNIKVYKIYLHVAHIDQIKSNCDPSNLISLCPQCHARFDAEFKSIKRKQYVNNIISYRTLQKELKQEQMNVLRTILTDFQMEVLKSNQSLPAVKIPASFLVKCIKLLNK
jgi:5-methylcytosine-specific restriction endonuclease McrA